MSGNYSDSEDEDGSYPPTTTTNVTLGFATTEDTGDALSHLGGEPTWLDPTSPPDPRLVKCGKCNSLMTLLIQLDGEVKESPHRRAFWVFVCVGGGVGKGVCKGVGGGGGAGKKGRKGGSGAGGRGDVKVLRGVVLRGDRKEEEEGKKVEEKKAGEEKKGGSGMGMGMGEMLFGGGAGGGGSAGSNPFSMGGGAGLGAGAGAGGNPFSIGGGGGATGGMFSTTTTKPTTNTTTSTQSTTTTTTTTSPQPKSFSETLKQNLPPPPPPPADPTALFGPPEPWPKPLPHTFPLYHLDAEYEQLDAVSPEALLTSTSKGVKHIPTAVDLLSEQPSGTGGSGGSTGGDEWGGYSKSDLDSTFQTFADRVAQNPEQVLRYEHRGAPLLYSKTDEVGIVLSGGRKGGGVGTAGGGGVPRCGNCGKERAFEFQVMPHAIAVLEEGDLDALASLEEESGMEWGTVLVYACTCVPKSVDARGVGYVEEWVGVQWEQRKR